MDMTHHLIPGPHGAQPLLATSSSTAKLQPLPSQSLSGPIRPWRSPLRTWSGKNPNPSLVRLTLAMTASEQSQWVGRFSL